MSIECGECERDLRGGHAEDCSRYPAAGLEMVPFRMATRDYGWLWRCGYRVGHLVVHEVDLPKRDDEYRWVISHAATGFGMPIEKTGRMLLSDAISLARALDAAVRWEKLTRGPSGEPGDIVGFHLVKRKASAALNEWLNRNRLNVDGETVR